MNKSYLAVFIAQLVCGLVCIALGIYYIFYGKPEQIAVFLIVGVVCIIMGIRTLLKYLKERKAKEQQKKEGGDTDGGRF